jgi:uncharacterized lipoprotein NlpE involved in copper resistance
MFNKYQVLGAVLVLCLFGCNNQTEQNGALPANGTTLKKFPDRIVGTYGTSDNQTFLTISEDEVFLTNDFDMKLSKNGELPPGFSIEGDTLIKEYMDGKPAEKQKITYINDSEFMTHEHYLDVVFKLTDSTVLKAKNGNYFLNEQMALSKTQTTWDVRRMTLSKGILVVSYIEDPKDIDKVPSVTESPTDTMVTFTFGSHSKVLDEVAADNKAIKNDTFYRISGSSKVNL